MNMDSDPQKWLGFSLSNTRYHMNIASSDSSELCLFEALNTAPTAAAAAAATATNSVSVVERRQEEEDLKGAIRGATELSMFATTGPKLENFLGGSAAAPPQSVGGSFGAPVGCTGSESSSEILYDSELKTIAASFLRGFCSTEQTAVQKYPQFAESIPRKSADTFGQRTSIYRGVTRHRWTGRYEAHLWDNSCRREGQSRKGRQVYLGGYDKEEKAARAYDLAALKYWGPTTTTNFPISNYEKELGEMKHMTRQEFVASLRRKSSGFSRGASIYRGVTRHHQHGRWQARIGRVAGNKDLYLGTFSTQEEAAEAYDIAAIKFRGLNAVTNFDMSRYDVKSIANSNLPVGGISNNKPKNSPDSTSDTKSIDGSNDPDLSSASSLTFAMPIKQDPTDYWSNIFGTTTKNTNNVVNSNNVLFQSSTFSGLGGNDSTNGYIQQQSVATSNALPFAAPMGLDSEGSSSYGNWIQQSLHTFQSAKPNISIFQTPIFGVE